MDLLSFVGLATRRQQEYFRQAKALAKKYKTQEKLEVFMERQSIGLVKAYRDKLMRWEEYERTLLDKTLVSALASVYLGAENNKPDEKMEKAWPTIVGNLLPPLTKFLAETQEYVKLGVLRLGDDIQDFADGDLDQVVPPPPLEGNLVEQGIEEAQEEKAQGRTWKSLAQRVIQYLARPTFSYFNLGKFFVAKEQGFRQMRRIAIRDKKTCKDCKGYALMGWQPAGSLPMPGQGCVCYARCRCSIEYR